MEQLQSKQENISIKLSVKDLPDKYAFFKRYYLKHNYKFINLDIDKAHKVAFEDQCKVQDLDYKEAIWIDKLNSKRNLAKTTYSTYLAKTTYCLK